MENQPPVTLAVLCGGRGSRMGGPKDQIAIAGRPILHVLLDGLQWAGPTLLVRSPTQNQLVGQERFHTIVADAEENQGPLAGVLTALMACTTDTLFVASVDMPGVSIDMATRLLNELKEWRAIDAVAFVHDGQIEPLPLAIRSSALSMVRERIAGGERSLLRLFTSIERFATIEAPQAWPRSAWANLNRPEDVAAFLSR